MIQVPLELQLKLATFPELRRRPELVEGILAPPPSARNKKKGNNNKENNNAAAHGVAGALPKLPKGAVMVWDGDKDAWVPRQRPRNRE